MIESILSTMNHLEDQPGMYGLGCLHNSQPKYEEMAPVGFLEDLMIPTARRSRLTNFQALVILNPNPNYLPNDSKRVLHSACGVPKVPALTGAGIPVD